MADIIVVGGGLTGAMMALTLSHGPYRIIHIDPKTKVLDPDNVRTTTINAAGKRMLETLGVWQALAKTPTPIHSLKVAEGPEKTRLRTRRTTLFDLSWQSGETPMAHVVPNDVLLAALETMLHDSDVASINDQQALGINHISDRVQLITDGPAGPAKGLDCQLVVGCDGRNSGLGRAAGIKHQQPAAQTNSHRCHNGGGTRP